jgi:hypothetical protein
MDEREQHRSTDRPRRGAELMPLSIYSSRRESPEQAVAPMRSRISRCRLRYLKPYLNQSLKRS